MQPGTNISITPGLPLAAWLQSRDCRQTGAFKVDLQARNATLEDIKASQNRYIGQYQKVLKERQSQLDLAEAALQECSVDEMNWNRERGRLEGDLEHAQNTVARLVEERDAAQAELRKHYGQRGPTCVKYWTSSRNRIPSTSARQPRRTWSAGWEPT